MSEAAVQSRLRAGRPAAPESLQISAPRDRLLESALRIFASKGVHAASIREITEAVGANVAAVNYYFGSKEGLVRAVLERYVRPIVRAREIALEELEQCDARPTTRDVAMRLVEPMVRMSRDRSGDRSIIGLLLQIRAFPTPELQQAVVDLFDEISHRFVAAFRRAEPELGEAAAYWRYNFALGAIMQVLTDANPATQRLERLSAGACRVDDATISSELVDFICAGMTPPQRRRAARRRE